jgi:integrase
MNNQTHWIQAFNIHTTDALRLLSSILLQYNCRASEILEATWQDFHYPYFLILRGKKHSANIIIRDSEILQRINSLPRLHNKYIFNYINYNSLYHFFKSNFGHLFTNFRGRKNYKITHGPRYFAARLVDDPKLVQSILYHNSLKSGKYYNNKLKEKQNGNSK